MEALATGSEADPISPEGIDCSAWFKQLQAMTFWNEIDVIAQSTRWSPVASPVSLPCSAGTQAQRTANQNVAGRSKRLGAIEQR